MSGHTELECEVRTFEVGGGRVLVDGKGRYPGMLRLKMDTYRAFRLIREIVCSLERDHESFCVDFLGELSEPEED